MDLTTLRDAGQAYQREAERFARVASCVEKYIKGEGVEDHLRVPGLEGFEAAPGMFRFRLFGASYMVRHVLPAEGLDPARDAAGRVILCRLDPLDPGRALAVRGMPMRDLLAAPTVREYAGPPWMTGAVQVGMTTLLAILSAGLDDDANA